MSKENRVIRIRSSRLPAFLFLMLLISQWAYSDTTGSEETVKTFRMAINRPEDSPLYKWVDMIYSEVFQRMNIELVLDSYPLNRASVEINSGNIDGEPARIYNYGDSFKNIIRVEEEVFDLTVMAYSTDPYIIFNNGWESLSGTKLRIEYPRGMKICENNLPKFVAEEYLSAVSETSQGLRRLDADRIDIYVDDRNSAIPIINDPSYDLQGQIYQAGIMDQVPLYMYVHKSKKTLIPLLEDTIRTLREEGLIEEYRKKAFGL